MSTSKCSGFGQDFFLRAWKLVCPPENHITGLMAKRMKVQQKLWFFFICNEQKSECTIAQKHLYCEENIFTLVLLISEQFHNTACVSRDKSSFELDLKMVIS